MYCTLHKQECVHISIEIEINTTDTTIIINYGTVYYYKM